MKEQLVGAADHAHSGFFAVAAMVFKSSFTAALFGRLVWHIRQVQKGERRMWSAELAYELPAVAACYWVANGLVAYLDLPVEAAQGVTFLIAYLGPDGFQALLERYLKGRPGA